MKKLIVAGAVAAACLVSNGRPGPHGMPPPMHGPRIHHAPPLPPRYHHHHHHSGGAFWSGVGVGLVGGLLAPAPAPVVIQAAPQRIWVPPVYGERPLYRAGIYVGTERYIVTPGYWTTVY